MNALRRNKKRRKKAALSGFASDRLWQSEHLFWAAPLIPYFLIPCEQISTLIAE
jgi:hypothetical protein